MKLNRIWLVAAVAFAVVLTGAVAWFVIPRVLDDPRAQEAVAIGGPFELVDHTGQTVTEQDFRGRLMLVFFGYTFCPDFCPTKLQDLSLALDQLEPEEVEEIAFLFVTIDPERDTPEQLAAYVEHFHPELTGLTGSENAVADAASAYRVYHAKQEVDGASDYLMDHSTFTYLMGRDGRYLTHFGHGTPPDEIAATLREHI